MALFVVKHLFIQGICQILLLGFVLDTHVDAVSIKFSSSSKDIELGETSKLGLIFNGTLSKPAVLIFTYEIGNDIKYTEDANLIHPVHNVTVPANDNSEIFVNITGTGPGHLILGVNSSSPEFENLTDQFVRIKIVRNSILVIINAVIGWVYFVAWSVSFYPQVVTNWQRKSVTGLNFDYLGYNITGFLAYGFFNIGMYWIPLVKNEYAADHPRGINPVQLNDVIFTLHAVLVTAVTIFQCIIYERGGQKVSRVSQVILVLTWLFAVISLFVAVGHKITWLTYLYYFSYIKLGVTLIKYVPQAYMNYTRKSTLGWSIGNVLLDFTGGSLSVLQMVLLSYNSDDWNSIFGDPTKFGLGLFSVLFDILFITQHYCLYRGRDPYESIQDKDIVVNSKQTKNTEKEPLVY
ncbi:LOW QUALITY PROTEIN: cystinosin-like [Gigantopelta aegis]|uniref:LOW QUALITY PROTEIN: cystinosin-like n=1 Tax=Gigantopelta aegis TaxID=1735272 RepID=UPI001B88A059|nr:LOW QUALITY PROTEIN: cystinosin-like [Gigantopelta aegis]